MAQDVPTPSSPGHPVRSRLIVARTPIDRDKARDDELKLFALSFTAFFVCIYTLIF